MRYIAYSRTDGTILHELIGAELPQDDLATGYLEVDPDVIIDQHTQRVEHGKFVLKPFVPQDTATEENMLAAVDQKRTQLQMQGMTPGSAVMSEYAAIQQEYSAYSEMSEDLSHDVLVKLFPTAMMEVELSGKSLLDVMAGYETAIAKYEHRNRIIGRIAVVGKERIRAAETLTDKRAAYRSIDWDWQPSF